MRAAQIPVQRNPERQRTYLGTGHRNTERCICPQITFVVRSVLLDQNPVDQSLIQRIYTKQRLSDLGIYIIDRLGRSESEISCFPITQFYGFKSSGTRAAWYGCPSRYALPALGLYRHFRLHRRISTGIQNFSCMHFYNTQHFFHKKTSFEHTFFPSMSKEGASYLFRTDRCKRT